MESRCRISENDYPYTLNPQKILSVSIGQEFNNVSQQNVDDDDLWPTSGTSGSRTSTHAANPLKEKDNNLNIRNDSDPKIIDDNKPPDSFETKPKALMPLEDEMNEYGSVIDDLLDAAISTVWMQNFYIVRITFIYLINFNRSIKRNLLKKII